MDPSPEDVYTIVRNVDKKNNGTIDFTDFCQAFKVPGEADLLTEEQENATGYDANNNEEKGTQPHDTEVAVGSENQELRLEEIQPRMMKELHGGHTKDYVDYKEVLCTPQVLSKIKVKVNKVNKFIQVWSTEASTAR